MSSKLWRLSNQKISAKKQREDFKHLTEAQVNQMYFTKKQARQNTSEEKHPSRLLKSLCVRIGIMHPDVLKFD